MTEEEIRAAVLAALLEYDLLKKTRRLRTVKRALRGTMMATVIGSTGIMAANQSRNAYVQDTVVAIAANAKVAPKANLKQVMPQRQIVAGVAHFGLNQHGLLAGHHERLAELTKQLPKDVEIVVVGRADAVGGYGYNKKLGKQRAFSVANYLASQGFKIKSVASKVSKSGPISWLNRRVDIVISHSALQPLAINLPPLIDQYDSSGLGTVAQSNSGLTANQSGKASDSTMQEYLFNHLKKDNKAKPVNLPGENALNINQATSTNATGISLAKSPLAHENSKPQKIAGVAHFASHHAGLTTAHKERLAILAKQIPQTAELTVVGRTGSSDVSVYDKKLSKQRALAVANYLASQGVKVSGIGIKAIRGTASWWVAQRVDILVKHTSAEPLDIHLPPLVRGQDKQHAERQNRSDPGNSKKVDRISKKVDTLLGRLYVDGATGLPYEDTARWWGEASKVNNMHLDKTSW